MEQRLDRALDRNNPAAVKGLSEGVLMKCLALVQPERFLSLPAYEGDAGKARLMELLGLAPLPGSLSVGARALSSNVVLREALAPQLPQADGLTATHAMRRFLYWL